MKKYFIIYFFIIISINLLSQNLDNNKSTKLIQLEVEYYTDSIPPQSWASFFWGSNYKGELIKGISQLYELPITRIKVNKYNQPHYIGYKIFSNDNLQQLEKLALASLAKTCDFTIKDINDTCSVWKIIVKDSTKLPLFSWEKDSPDGTTYCNFKNGNKDRDYFGQTLTALAYLFEVDSEKYIFETDSDDKMDNPQRYKFVIPLESIKNINLLKPFMLEKYGIDFIPITRGIEKKYIEFNKKE